MKKSVPSQEITNELAGSSVFFEGSNDRPVTTTPTANKEHVPESQTKDMSHQSEMALNPPGNHATMLPRNRDTTTISNQDAQRPLINDAATVDDLDEVRKAVKQLGKDAATYRFRTEEKSTIADIVYSYSRQGVRTSENEITRIAVNWLLMDYHKNGANSVLARVLEALHG